MTINNDANLLKLCQKSMKDGDYDAAIEYTNQMTNKTIAIKAHLLVIEHAIATEKKSKQA
ncbi:MAG: hypothetical protein ACKO37_03280 [Vampirovibrionales bacterium]